MPEPDGAIWFDTQAPDLSFIAPLLATNLTYQYNGNYCDDLGFWAQPPDLLRNVPVLAANLCYYIERGKYCDNCKYRVADLTRGYVCACYPPLVVATHDKVISLQPTLPASNWCGEFDEVSY